MRDTRIVAGIAALALVGCGLKRPVVVKPTVEEKTCLVLSVGGAKGLAHIGAIEAVKESGIKIDCVYGNSMGSLIGGLYASDPNVDVANRYRGFISVYEKETRSSASGAGLLLGVGSFLLGGAGLVPWLIGGAGAASVPLRDLKRFERVLDDYTGGADVSELTVPYGTSYQIADPGSEGVSLIVVGRGKLSKAIGASISNPFIFKGLDVKKDPIDPGADRVAAVPVEDAFMRFKPTRIIVVNVTGEPAFYSKRVTARVDEIFVPVCVSDIEDAMTGKGPAFEEIRGTGYSEAKAMLARYQNGKRVDRGYLGVATELGRDGVEVVNVVEGGPAANAGVQVGDFLRTIGGAPVECEADMLRLGAGAAPGTETVIGVVRDGTRLELRAIVGEHPRQFLD